MQKTQMVFSRGEQSILYQITQRSHDCYYKTENFSFFLTRCEQFLTGEVLFIVGTVAEKSDNTLNTQKRLTIQEIKIISEKPNSLYYWKAHFYQIREKIWSFLVIPVHILLEQPHSGVLLSMVFGKKEYLDKITNELFLATGSTHLQVVSGYNFSVIFAGLYQASSRLAGKRVQAVLLMIAATIFLGMLGISPSVIRAYGMLIALIFSKFVLLRQYKSMYCLVLLTLLFLYLQPTWLSSVSFQLTFSATAGIILLLPILYTSSNHYFPQENGKSFERISSSGNLAKDFLFLCWESFMVSLSAQLATVPILLWYFHQFSLSGLLVTTFLFWLISLITLVGFFLTVIIACLFPFLFTWILQLPATIFLWLPLEFFIQILEYLAQIKWFIWDNLEISLEFFIIYYFLLIVWVVVHQYGSKRAEFLAELDRV